MMISRKPGLKYVHRGNPVAYDYDHHTLIRDGAWHTLDLSAIIPANAKLVHLRLGISGSATGSFFRVAKTGVTNGFAMVNLAVQVAYINNETDAIVDCTGQQVDYWSSETDYASGWIVVLGWFV